MKKITTLIFSLLPCFVIAQNIGKAAQNQVKTKEWSEVKKANLMFGSSNVRYTQNIVPIGNLNSQEKLTGWRGEKLNAQLLFWSNAPVEDFTLKVGDLESKSGQVISNKYIKAGFVGYTLTDEFGQGCGYRKSKDFDSSLVADIIGDELKPTFIKAKNTYPIWLSVNIPADAKPGEYTANITANAKGISSVSLTIKVMDRLLPNPSNWRFDLDLWQHPAAIARVHQQALWSDEHFAAMKKYYTLLAQAGQKTVTASIVNEPWGHQTYDDYPSLIKWTKRKNGKWLYDYSLFDRYVQFVMDCGINQRINCYSMAPWKIAFTYFDETTGKEAVFTDAIGTPSYDDFWRNMLIDFTAHLKQKGWFQKTYIAMDERPMKTMQSIIALLKTIDKDWKIALAGEFHPEIEKDIANYCIASKWNYPNDVLARRIGEKKVSTWYTCCTEPYPNVFTFSPPAEAVWIGWYTAAKDMDGYLRWAYNSWPKNPLSDSRFTAWPAGDTFLVYPGPLSSIRFEKLIEGAQDYEKIQWLKKHYQSTGNTEALAKLNSALATLAIKDIASTSADLQLKKLKPLLN